jgi:fructose-1,6-bisphosphatase/inositol monophosphatase family enzyme
MGDSAATPEPADLGTARAALEWVREAGELTLGHFGDPGLVVDRKGDGSPVTRADREAEALLRRRIAAAHPEDAVHGEEGGHAPGSSGRTWVIDPIDGTLAFSHGVATYANLLYLDDGLGPAVGIIHLPALGETVWAARGHGCFRDDTPVRPAGRGEDAGGTGDEAGLDGRVLCVSGFHHWEPERFARVGDAGVLVRTWGDAYGYALVATGRADAMFDPVLEWWDLAAPMVVLAEAGATLTRGDGAPDPAVPHRRGPYGFSALASNGGAHQRWVELLGHEPDQP